MTLGNAVCGFGAITLATGGADPATSLFAAAGLIFLAMIFDTLDGSAARWTNQATPFGAQLDSLCDAISFGAAPALLMFRFSLPHGYTPRLLWPVAALYVACTVLRLARFNVRADDRGPAGSFRGLPSPAAAGTVASFPVLVYGPAHLDYPGRDPAWDEMAGWFAAAAGRVLPAVTLAVACLMVSSVRYAHVVRHLVRGRRPGRYVIKLVFAVAVISVLPEISALLLFGWYTFATPVGAGWKKCAGRLIAHSRPDPS